MQPVTIFLAIAIFTGIAGAQGDDHARGIPIVGHAPYPPILGGAANEVFGSSVSGAGDVNNDGRADFIVGAPSTVAGGAGMAKVYSGLDGSVLYTFLGAAGDFLGSSVSGAGDMNNDGFDDVIVGTDGAGVALVYSGVDGAVLYTFSGSISEGFGQAVSGAGDVNNDGFDDVIVGAPFDDGFAANRVQGTTPGAAHVFSGLDGSTLFTFFGDDHDDRFGDTVSGAGDVNNDGFDDVVVAARLDDDNGQSSGSVRVFCGATGTVVNTFFGDFASDQFGFSVGGAGDVNDDGLDDIIVGAPFNDQGGFNAGLARVFSVVDGSILYTFLGSSTTSSVLFGASVSGAGDVNGDGFGDLIVGASSESMNGTASGSVRVFSGGDGSVLYTLPGYTSFLDYGSAVSGAGDVNDDGFDDFIIGARGDDSLGANNGSVQLFFSATLTPQPVCPGDTNGDGVVDLADLNTVLFNFGLACP